MGIFIKNPQISYLINFSHLNWLTGLLKPERNSEKPCKIGNGPNTCTIKYTEINWELDLRCRITRAMEQRYLQSSGTSFVDSNVLFYTISWFLFIEIHIFEDRDLGPSGIDRG